MSRTGLLAQQTRTVVAMEQFAAQRRGHDLVVTGEEFVPDREDPHPRLARNIGQQG